MALVPGALACFASEPSGEEAEHVEEFGVGTGLFDEAPFNAVGAEPSAVEGFGTEPLVCPGAVLTRPNGFLEELAVAGFGE